MATKNKTTETKTATETNASDSKEMPSNTHVETPFGRITAVIFFANHDGIFNSDPDTKTARMMPDGTVYISKTCMTRVCRETLQELIQVGDPDFSPDVDDVMLRIGCNSNNIESAEVQAYFDSIAVKNGEENYTTEHLKAFQAKLFAKYADRRFFGGPTLHKLATKSSSGALGRTKAPVLFSPAKSYRPVILEGSHTCTFARDSNDETARKRDQNMFSVRFMPYALFKMEIHINPMAALKTGFTREDVKKLYKVLITACSTTESQVRGRLEFIRLAEFEQKSALGGSQPIDQLIDSVQYRIKPEIDTREGSGFHTQDYEFVSKFGPKYESVNADVAVTEYALGSNSKLSATVHRPRTW